MRRRLLLLLVTATACGPKAKAKPVVPEDPKLDVADEWVDPELYLPRGLKRTAADRTAALTNANAKPIVIEHATIMTAAGVTYDDASLYLEGGAITYVGRDAHDKPAGATVIDGTGLVVTPGIIDAHSHLGVYPAPNAGAHGDGNEGTAPITAQVRAVDAYWPEDPQIPRALAGGVTTALILPGSANLIGGHGFTVQMRTAPDAEDVRFPGAPDTVKMACGENPKRVYGEKGGPQTRMGEYAMFRAAFAEGAAYEAKLRAYARDRAQWLKKRERAAELDAVAKPGRKKIDVVGAPAPVDRDLRLETLAGIVRGEILVQVHCYKSSDMARMVEIADEFGFSIRSFHHALEAYKIRDLLVTHDIAINTWADWYGFKLESFDGIPENAGLFAESGGRATIHSDSAIGIQRLNQEAGKARAAARDAGIDITEDAALRWITANPAWVLGIDDVTGTLEVGKRADVTVWSGSPFSVYSQAKLVIIAGQIAYDRAAGRERTDYELGNSAGDRGGAK